MQLGTCNSVCQQSEVSTAAYRRNAPWQIIQTGGGARNGKNGRDKKSASIEKELE
jgi:hypothetical protein